MLSSAYFPAKIRFNRAENEPAKNSQNLSNNYKIKFQNFAKISTGDDTAANVEALANDAETTHDADFWFGYIQPLARTGRALVSRTAFILTPS